MNKGRILNVWIMCGIFVLAYAANGQSRKEVSLRGNMAVGVGPSTAHTSNLNYYLNGTERLAQPKPANGAGALGSSIYQPQSYTQASRTAAPVPSAHATPSFASKTTRIYTPKTPAAMSFAPPAPARRSTSWSGFTGSYVAAPTGMLDALTVERTQASIHPDKPITSLVPETTGAYRNFMEAGERAFRAGSYSEAQEDFKKARSAAPTVPGAMMACMLTGFALSDGSSYKASAEYLAKALEVFPDLPLLNFSPRGYFGKAEDFDAAMKRLAAHVQARPDDAYGQFLLAYLAWHQGQYDPAEKAAEAVMASKNPTLTAAMETLIRAAKQTATAYDGPLAKLQAPQAYPWAGVEMALPEGFTGQSPDQAPQVLEAMLGDPKQPEEYVGLYAFSVSKDTTPGLFVAGAMDELRKDPNFENLREVDQGGGKIADLDANTRKVEYSHRGRSCQGILACFIREVRLSDSPTGTEPVRIAYLLAVETLDTKKDDLLPTAAAVARSIRLTELKRPIDLPLHPGSTALDPAAGLSVNVPAGWARGIVPEGVLMGQMDFLLGGVASPVAHAGVANVEKRLSPEQIVAKLKESDTKKGYSVEVLSQGPAKLGGHDAHQVVLRKQVKPEGVDDPEVSKYRAAAPLTQVGPPFLEVTRFFTTESQDAQGKVYYLSLAYFDCDPKKAEEIMDVLAEGFRVTPAQAADTTAPAKP